MVLFSILGYPRFTPPTSKSDLSRRRLERMSNSDSEICAQTARKESLTEKPRRKCAARRKHQPELRSNARLGEEVSAGELLRAAAEGSSVWQRRHAEAHRLSGCFCAPEAPPASDAPLRAQVHPGSDHHPRDPPPPPPPAPVPQSSAVQGGLRNGFTRAAKHPEAEVVLCLSGS